MFCFVFRNLDLLQEVEVLDAQASLQATLLIIHQHDLDLKRGQDIQDPNLGQDLNPGLFSGLSVFRIKWFMHMSIIIVLVQCGNTF